ncbi:MAG: hypothetical protein JSR54_13485, partial [Proteobacteria bacterium]|nr:hypothetical protein [Pseudomonadota bacterium]
MSAPAPRPIDIPTDDPTAAPLPLEQVVGSVAVAAGVLGCEMADIAGTVDDMNRLAHKQAEAFEAIHGRVAAMRTANEDIRGEATAAAEGARATRRHVEAALGAAVDSIEAGLGSVGGTLAQISGATHEIARIALQTRVVALNASVQAAHAGQHGRSFAIVADSVRDLAEQIQRASQTIATTLEELGTTVRGLARRDGADAAAAAGAASLRASVEQALERFRSEFAAVEQRVAALAGRAEANAGDCSEVERAAHAMADEVTVFERSLAGAAGKAGRLLSMSEDLIEITAASGAETDDTPFIESAMDAAREISARFEAAIGAGRIGLDGLFDERYRPVPGSDPQQ